ncbi:replication initiation protein RepM [Wohlfahrtiimonas chitiniclastica]|uniref:replication initiation protein RepM n=1 Tax=Wohlfahrtiimonas chitiniclastica TaxID=400946 RepID=UPI001BCFCD2F|nr:replication initiation protein RepM [Wohlfahrtiimonas chitiniclastica]MBS7837238.1 replication initiation protein RepM [Wohlfahrtiimonas chitiniclastica]
MSKKDIVVKDNTLINASYTLNLTEQRILLLSISKAQKTGREINNNDYLSIHVSEFVTAFNTDEKSVYRDLKTACDTLFKREFSYKKGSKIVRSHWLQSSTYDDKNGQVEILFAKELIPFINHLKERFTSYFLEDVASMSSVYAIRLYELIIAWRTTHKTPVFDLGEFRSKLGVKPDEYTRMNNFKARVLDVAVKQINEFSNIQIKVEQHKKGRSISGFSFTFVEIKAKDERDPNTRDWVDESGGGSPVADVQAILKKMTNSTPEKKKRKIITQQQAEQLARVGESWDDFLERTKDIYFVKFDKK